MSKIRASNVLRHLRERPEDMPAKHWRRMIFYAWRRYGLSPRARSALEFFVGIMRRWFLLIPGAFLGLLSLYGQIVGGELPNIAPEIIWPVVLLGFFWATLAEYDETRRERDRLLEDPKSALNEHLANGHSLRERLLARDHKPKDGGFQMFRWVHVGGGLVQRKAPAYYRQWEVAVSSDDTTSKQFLDGITALDDICREIGLPQATVRS